VTPDIKQGSRGNAESACDSRKRVQGGIPLASLNDSKTPEVEPGERCDGPLAITSLFPKTADVGTHHSTPIRITAHIAPPYGWRADLDRIIAAVKRGHQLLRSIRKLSIQVTIGPL
jgi:hypothetical protein